MSQGSPIRLSISSILNVPLQTYQKDFSFIVNGEEFRTSRLISDLLSPVICQIHSNDPTVDSFTINTQHHGDFSHILHLTDFNSSNIPSDQLPFIVDVFGILGIQCQEEIAPIEITFDNVLDLISQHERYGIFYRNHLSREIDFASAHFYELCENRKEELSNLSVDTLFQIMSNDQLQLNSEDQLLNFINDLYSQNSMYSILYETVLFVHASAEVIRDFTSLFSAGDMTAAAWLRISQRLDQKIECPSEGVDGEVMRNRYREHPIENRGSLFEYTGNNEFRGIFSHLTSQGQIGDLVGITSSSVVNSSACYQPGNVLRYGDTNNYFHSNQMTGNWICFDFKDRRVIPTHYTLKSVNWGVNSNHPRSWVVEGRTEGGEFETIDEESDCAFLNGVSLVHTFALSRPSSKEFKYIRVRLTGPDWANANYLIFDSFEIYGRLI
ncbi:hypothetical protein M9Y10_007175 [Tritrichomonas musculus]|uniref:F5/8 type C domain-containing protein n=1 Tax=Tritrichomonas musculus TaxID=1915356 RepID=A0ABR2J100_9EUKA